MRGSSQVLAAVVALLVSASSVGSVITYEVTNLAGSTWRYDYTLYNDSLTQPVDEFTIFFALDADTNLRDAMGPSDWDLFLSQPDPQLPDDGYMDGLALVGSLGVGATLGGFSITFDFLGAGTPGSQRFDFIDATTFEVLDTGFTSLAAVEPPPTSVPEPSSYLLMIAGLLGVGLMRLRRLESAFVRRTSDGIDTWPGRAGVTPMA